MPAAKQVTIIEIDDAKIFELLTDTGVAPTYATAIDIPDIVEMVVEPQLKVVMREGDSVVKGIFQKTTHLKGTIRMKSVPLDVLAILIGGTVTNTGTTPNQVTDFTQASNAKGKYFKLIGRAVEVDGLDAAAAGVQVMVYKAKLSGNPKVTMNGEYAEVNAEFTGVYTNSDNKLWNLKVEETKTAIT